MASLKPIFARLDWVRGHLEDLEIELALWMETATYRGVGEWYPEAGISAARLKMTPPPLEWGVVAGNIVHNVRSALDNLVWQLVLWNGNIPKGGVGGNSFPVYRTPAANFSKAAATALRGVHPTHVAKIESIQPQNRPQGIPPDKNPFALLSELNNADKHRLLTPITIGGTPGHTALSHFKTFEPNVVTWRKTFLNRLEDGAVVACWEVAPSYVAPVVFELEMPLQVQFRELPGNELVKTLGLLMDSTGALISEFAPDFGEMNLLPRAADLEKRGKQRERRLRWRRRWLLTKTTPSRFRTRRERRRGPEIPGWSFRSTP